jgi:hypothetical protein
VSISSALLFASSEAWKVNEANIKGLRTLPPPPRFQAITPPAPHAAPPLEPQAQLREQPYVLDRDHRLVGEGLDERDLLVRERK